MKRIATTVVIAGIALAGCAAVEKDASYKTLNDLGSAVQTASGEKCDARSTSSNSMTKNGWDQETCGSNTSIALFADQETQKTVRLKNPADAGKTLLEGPNWIVWSPTDTARKIQEKLGGNFRTAPQQITVTINVLVHAPYGGILRVSDTQKGPGRWCYGSSAGTGLLKDLGPDSEASITSQSGLFKSAKLTNSVVVDGDCRMTYVIPGITTEDGPYKVQVGGRDAGSRTETELRSGLELQIGK
ncbi:hypothetical protein [Arthrobacter sp. efr-133-R2A-63]|uniref:hypothetical protein n=1 Tax=Arthrobacter sp. efr-133-R2A-63 TaxID=3040278 RepID=UPI0025500E06|nr:hypothetical protein [Arthrobacter sp. efr-133-R2A-63]